MSPADAQIQAEKLRSFVTRGGSAELWWRSKNFTSEQRMAVETALAEMRRSRS